MNVIDPRHILGIYKYLCKIHFISTLNCIKGTLNIINVYKFPNFGFLGLTRILYAYTPSSSIRKFRTEWQHLSQSAAPMQAGSRQQPSLNHPAHPPIASNSSCMDEYEFICGNMLLLLLMAKVMLLLLLL